MCEFLLSVFITGAMETAPGWMTVDYMSDDRQVERIHIPTREYLSCWNYPFIPNNPTDI